MASRRLSHSPRRPERLALAIALAFACGRATAGPLAAEATAAEVTSGPGGETLASSFSVADLKPPSLGSINSDQADTQLLLDVSLAGRATRKFCQFVLRQGQLWATPEDLRELGLVIAPGLPVGDDGRMKLDDIAGLRYDYDPANQSVDLRAAPALRPNQRLGYRAPEPVHADPGTGLVLDYDAYARHAKGQSSLSVGTSLRWFGRAGALEFDGVLGAGASARAFQRLDTHWTYSDPVHLWTWTAGDLVSGGLAWTRPVRMGGVQWRRNFGLRPGLVTFPIPRFASQATVPSSVELLIDNVRQFGGEVDDGPFVLGSFPSVSGAGEAVLVVRDALGRLTQTSVPIYTDVQRLAPGTMDFSVEAGLLRRGLGGYGRQPSFSGSLRRGLLDSVTIELHAETAAQVHVAGVGLVWSPLARWGLVTASVARSRGQADGWQRTLGYQWNSARFGLDLQSQRGSAGFRDLGSADALEADARGPMRAQDRASGWLPLGAGNLGFSWIRWRDDRGVRGRIETLSWSSSFHQVVRISGSLFRDHDAGTGVGLSLSLPLGHGVDSELGLVRSATQGFDTVATLRHEVPYEGGWGWRAQASSHAALAAATLRGRAGEASVGLERNAGEVGAYLQASGGVVWMEGELFASRRISDAFSVVSTAGVPGVPVLVENRVLGLTDAKGFLLVPDLHGWQANLIAIDPDQLGAGYRLPALEQHATPADHAGVLVRFDIAQVRSAIAVLLDAAGDVVTAGSTGRVVGGDEAFLVGNDGETYLDDVKAGSVLALDTAGHACRYRLPERVATADAVLDLGTLRCEAAP